MYSPRQSDPEALGSQRLFGPRRSGSATVVSAHNILTPQNIILLLRKVARVPTRQLRVRWGLESGAWAIHEVPTIEKKKNDLL